MIQGRFKFAITAKLGGNGSSAAQNLYKRSWEGYFKIISYSPSQSLPRPSPEPLQFQLRSQPQYQLQSLRQSLRSLRDSDDTRLGWDPGPRHLYLSGDLGEPGPPSGPAHLAQASHPHLGLSHLQSHQLQRRHHRLSCHLLPGFGGRYSSGTPSRGMYGSTVESSIRSHTTTFLH